LVYIWYLGAVPRQFEPVQRENGQPLSLQVYRAVADAIAGGELRPGDRLPSERVLTEEFGVSRVTLRKALSELVDEGQLEVAPKSGWFVTEPPLSDPPTALLSFSEMARSRGLSPSARVLESRARPASLEEADKLRIAPGAQVFELARVRLLDGIPVAVDRSRLPLARAPFLTEIDFASASLYESLAAHGELGPVRAEYLIHSRAATGERAKLLELKAGDPVLWIEGTIFDQHERPLELGEIAYRGDRYAFRATLKRPADHVTRPRDEPQRAPPPPVRPHPSD
jgi:GntR family transcriptional regulator